MIPNRKNRIWCAALLIFLISSIALLDAPAESWKQIIVKCSPEDLDQIRAQVGAAIVDAIPGHFLLTVSSTTDVKKIESIRGNGAIEASDNSPVFIQRRRPQTNSTGSASAPSKASLGGTVDWYGTPARQGYIDQPAVGKIRLKEALNIATGQGIRVAIIDTGVDEQDPT